LIEGLTLFGGFAAASRSAVLDLPRFLLAGFVGSCGVSDFLVAAADLAADGYVSILNRLKVDSAKADR
jgi:hypothetical protein